MSNFDPAAIIAALDRGKVSYVVVGGVAVLAHGHLRTTQDLDLVPDPDPPNLARLAVALADLEGTLRHPAGPQPVDAERLASFQIAPVDTRHGRDRPQDRRDIAALTTVERDGG